MIPIVDVLTVLLLKTVGKLSRSQEVYEKRRFLWTFVLNLFVCKHNLQNVHPAFKRE